MFDKIKNYHKHPVFHELRDIRVLGMIVFAVIVLMVCWSGVRVIETNYQLEQEIARMNEQNKLKGLENTNKKLQNEYYKTDEYLELQSRRSFGKAAPGETLVLVPKSVAMSRTVELPGANQPKVAAAVTKKPLYQRNFEAWIQFLFHRKDSDI